MVAKAKSEGVRRLWDKYIFVGLVMLIGAALLLWPSGSGSTGKQSRQSSETAVGEDLADEMEQILAAMSGVGQVRVMLTLDSDGERQLAQDGELSYSGSAQAPEDYSRKTETVVLDSGGSDEPLVTRRTYPTYRGALVVCQGADQAEVRLAVTEAVMALTGLSADRITVAKWQ